MIKAGAQRIAAELGLMLVAPDTSPRGVNLPGDSDSWDFGIGAGFYLDATQEPWSRHFRMYSYVVSELPALVNAEFPADPERTGIFGHSMGGHGALVIALRNPQQYRSISAFAPIAAPKQCPVTDFVDDTASSYAWSPKTCLIARVSARSPSGVEVPCAFT